MFLKKSPIINYMSKYSQYDIPNSSCMIDFSVGQPCKSMLGIDIIKDSLKNITETEFFSNEEILQYSDIKGLNDFRKNLANWINNKLDNISDFNSDNFMILNGITGIIQTILESMYFPEDIILVEETTYFLMIDIFKDYGLKIDYIPSSNDGIDFDALANKLIYLSENQDKVFLYMIPFFHNPSGKTICLEEIKKFKNIFEIYENFYVLSDEVYYFLEWSKREKKDCVLPLAHYHNNFISMGSFSKMIGPSLRIGYVLSKNESFIEELNYNSNLKSSGGICVFNSVIINSILVKNKLDSHLCKVINILKKRHDTMIKELDKANEILVDKGLFFEYSIPNGGYFVLVKICDNGFFDECNYKSKIIDYLLDECKINRVSFLPGEKFNCSDNDEFLLNFRLSFSYYNEEEISEGINRILLSLLNLEKVRIVTFGGNSNELLKSKLEKFSCFESYCNLNSDCSNIENIKISKYNKTIFINLTEKDELDLLINKILENLDDLGDNKDIFLGNLMIISKKNLMINKDKLESYALYNPVLLVDSYSKIELVDQKVIKLISQLYKDNNYEINENSSLFEINSNNFKLSLMKNDYNTEMSNIIKYIFCILGKFKGINYFDNNEEDKCMVIQKFFDQNYLIVKESNNFKINNIISRIIDNDKKFFGKIDGIIIESNNYIQDYMKIEGLQDNYTIDFINKRKEKNHYYSLVYAIYIANSDLKESATYVIKNKSNTTEFKLEVNTIYMIGDKSININYETTLEKVKDIFSDYDFIKLNNLRMINTRNPVVVVDCNCNLKEVDKCILAYVKNLIKNIVPKNFSVIFVNTTNISQFICLNFDSLNFNNVFSAVSYLVGNKMISEESICNYIHYSEEDIKEIELDLIITKRNDKYSIGLDTNRFLSKDIHL